MQIENAIALFTMGVGVLVLLTRKCPVILGPLLIGVGGYLWWTERERHDEQGKETLSVDEIPWWVWAGVGVAAFWILMVVIFSFSESPTQQYGRYKPRSSTPRQPFVVTPSRITEPTPLKRAVPEEPPKENIRDVLFRVFGAQTGVTEKAKKLEQNISTLERSMAAEVE
jgi:hypothetical protein